MPSTLRLARQTSRPAFLVGVDLPRHIETKEQALPLFRGAKSWLISEGFIELRQARARLRMTSNLPANCSGQTWNTRPLLVEMKPGPTAIYFVGLLVHEWMEGWFMTMDLTVGSVKWQREGLCELARDRFYYCVDTRYTYGYQQGIRRNGAIVYSEGFRRQSERFAGQSLRDIASYIRRTRRLA